MLTKDKWSNDDNRKLFDLHKKLGSKWKEIAACFTQRTDNGIKNQFFSIIRKSLRKACKYCYLPINPSTINTIKPKILSQFVNDEKEQNAIQESILENNYFGDQKRFNDNQTTNLKKKNQIKPFEQNPLNIEDVVQKFAFGKPTDTNSDFKNNLKNVLVRNLEALQEIKSGK